MNTPWKNFAFAALLAGTAFSQAAAAPPNSPVMQQQGSGPGYRHLQSREAQATDALQAGDAHKASLLAAQLLRENTDKSSWNYGNVVYDANQLLGLAALRFGHIKDADAFLLAAGHTPGSPQLDSFGPEMNLAKALYAVGETATVNRFLDLVVKFWGTAKPGEEQFKSLYEGHAALIHHWQTLIAAGQTPSLDRFDSYGDTPPQAAPAPLPLLAIGRPAPDFQVTIQNGKTIHLSDYKGMTVVLDFWATWCGPCQISLPHTNSIAHKYAGKNVIVLAVNVWDTQNAFDQWLPKHPEYKDILFAIDPTQAKGQDIASRLYHVSGIPTQYVISPMGIITQTIVGYGGPSDDLANAIQAASSQAAPLAKS